MEKEELRAKINSVAGKEMTKSLLSDISLLIEANKQDIELFEFRALLYEKLELFGSAINDYQHILSLQADHKKALSQISYLKSILFFNNTDIYASPNTNFDPWLD